MAKQPAKKATATRAAKPKVTRKTAASNASVWQNVATQFKGFALSPAALMAEFLGTFVLALMIVNYSGSQLVGLITLAVLVLLFAQFSGPHLNPAFTIGAWLNRQVTGAKAVAYVVAQVLGALLALVVAKAFLPEEVNPFTGETTAGTLYEVAALPEEAAALWTRLGAEAIGMAVFALGFAYVLLSRAGTLTKAFALGGAFFLGLVLMREAVVLNPAVALTVGGLTLDAWSMAIYLLVPVAVSAVAIAVYRLMQRDVRISE